MKNQTKKLNRIPSLQAAQVRNKQIISKMCRLYVYLNLFEMIVPMSYILYLALVQKHHCLMGKGGDVGDGGDE